MIFFSLLLLSVNKMFSLLRGQVVQKKFLPLFMLMALISLKEVDNLFGELL